MIVILLGLYLAIIIIRPMDWWEPVLNWPIVNIGAILTGLIGAPVLVRRSKVIWRQIPQLKIAFIFWMGLMLSYASHINFSGTLMVFQEFGKIIFFFILLLVLIEDLRGANTLLLALLVGIAFLGIHAIMQHHTGVGFGGKLPSARGIDPNTGATVWQARAFGTFDDPNDLCLALVVGIPLFYVLLKNSTNPIQKIFAITGIVCSAYGGWCTNSRGGVVAAFGMIGSSALIRLRGVKRYMAAVFGFSAVTLLAPSRFGGGGGFVGKDRALLWGQGLDMFKSNPLFGVGYDSFAEHADEHLVAHNSFVHTLAEGGLAAYLPFFLLLYLTMIHLRRLINQKQIISTNDRRILTGVFAALAGDFTAMYFISRQYQHIFYAILAVAITLTYLTSVKYNLQNHVFGPARKDIRTGLLWGLGSIVVLWASVRIVNHIS